MIVLCKVSLNRFFVGGVHSWDPEKPLTPTAFLFSVRMSWDRLTDQHPPSPWTPTQDDHTDLNFRRQLSGMMFGWRNFPLLHRLLFSSTELLEYTSLCLID